MKTLGGTVFVCDGLKYDYCYVEAVQSLLGVCDQVAILLFDDEDRIELESRIKDPRLKIIQHTRKEWGDTKSKYKLSFWTNEAKKHIDTEWYFQLQADEIIHENSYELIKRAIEEPEEAYVVRRVNLWGDPYHYINYPKVEARKGDLPCGNHTGRLAKIKYNSWNDAENIDAPFSHKYWETIKTYHMGFVRKREIMTPKTINIQEVIFECGRADERCYDDIKNNDGVFNPYSRFPAEDLLSIIEPLPKVIQSWAKDRAYGAVDPFAVVKA